MNFKNTSFFYGSISAFFHWLMAFLIIGMLAMGLYMSYLPHDSLRASLHQWHKEIGMILLSLIIFRSLWTLLNAAPSMRLLPPWQRLLARCTHFTLYVFMFFLPLTGWLKASAENHPIHFFGWFIFPALIAPHKQWGATLAIMHQWLSYGLIGVIIFHTLAALYHHFIKKDDSGRGMW